MNWQNWRIVPVLQLSSCLTNKRFSYTVQLTEDLVFWKITKLPLRTLLAGTDIGSWLVRIDVVFSCVLKIVKSWVVSIVMSTTTNQPHMPSNPSSEVSIEEIGAEEELAQCEKDRDDVRHGWVKVIYSYYPCVKRHYQNCFKSTKGGPTSNKIRALVGSKSEASNQKSVLSTSGCMLAKNMYGWT